MQLEEYCSETYEQRLRRILNSLGAGVPCSMLYIIAAKHVVLRLVETVGQKETRTLRRIFEKWPMTQELHLRGSRERWYTH